MVNRNRQDDQTAPRRLHGCSVCGSTFIYHKDLRRHQNSLHPEINNWSERFFCKWPDCKWHIDANSKGFARKDHLRQHMNVMHLSQEPPLFYRASLSNVPGPGIDVTDATSRQISEAKGESTTESRSFPDNVGSKTPPRPSILDSERK